MLLYDASKFKNLLLGLSSPGVDRSTSRKAETLGLKLKPQTLNLHPPPPPKCSRAGICEPSGGSGRATGGERLVDAGRLV